MTEENWLDLLSGKMSALDWKAVENDLRPFLEVKDDLFILTPDNLEPLLSSH